MQQQKSTYSISFSIQNLVEAGSGTVLKEGGVNYLYGYQSYEKDKEVYGEGNAYTAMFWEYDSRLGRRCNVDPVVKEGESPYGCFANNPIQFRDTTVSDTVVDTENGEPSVTLPDAVIFPRIDQVKPILNKINSRPIPATVP